ncbi:hypothetical protein AAULR_22264 [Lacticaseibacillus rhamnosus MTCC 5462]|nr:hypothetical protein AAULR_22264 [Lacticaseibacillus rhamnosus MTCC 5462]
MIVAIFGCNAWRNLKCVNKWGKLTMNMVTPVYWAVQNLALLPLSETRKLAQKPAHKDLRPPMTKDQSLAV